jgi:hypothetical protein
MVSPRPEGVSRAARQVCKVEKKKEDETSRKIGGSKGAGR